MDRKANILPILKYPDTRLRLKGLPVEVIDQSIKDLAADMLATMYDSHGIGLAAAQVNVQKRVVVIDLSDPEVIKRRGVEMSDLAAEAPTFPLVLINPEIIAKDGESFGQEGCLSVPDVFDNVKRASTVTLKYLTLDNESVTVVWTGLLAICIQHEIDHLNGVVFVDYLSDLKRGFISKKLKKQQKLNDEAKS